MTKNIGNLTLVYYTMINNGFFEKCVHKTYWKFSKFNSNHAQNSKLNDKDKDELSSGEYVDEKNPFNFLWFVNVNAEMFIVHPKKSELIVSFINHFSNKWV